MAVDSSGNVYVGGNTLSTDGLILNPVQGNQGGRMDGFLVKFSSVGVLKFGTFLGGTNDDTVNAVAVDSAGRVHVAGGTDSPDFPVTNAVQGSIGGGQDAFVAKIATSGTPSIVWSTYLGGSGGTASSPEQANGIALDPSGNVYVTGATSSTNFPVSAGSLQTSFAGSRDAFLTKISADGLVRAYSTYLGTIGFDWANGVAVDANGAAYLAGYTSSASFPTIGPLQSGFGGLYDAFVVKVAPAGNALLFSTLYGGSGADVASAIAVDASGNMFVGGQTSSSNFPVQNALQNSNAGGNTGWLARLGDPVSSSQPPTADSASIVVGVGNVTTVTAQFSDPAGAASLTTVAVLLGNSTSLDFACHVTFTLSANKFALTNDVASSGATNVTPGSGSAQNNQCTLYGSGSSAVAAGNTLTVTLQLSLATGFPPAGANVIYIKASNAGASTGWVAKGGLPKPLLDSVSPSSASGATQTFTFTFSDTQSPLNLTGMAMLFKDSLTYTNACYIVYDRLAGNISLLYDNAGGSIRKSLGSPAALQNSQCSVGLVTALISGQSVQVTATITFKPAFNGTKNIYMFASEIGQNTGWVKKGAYTVATGGAPTVVGVSPNGSAGTGGIFNFTVADAGGSNFITGITILFSTSQNLNNACLLNYDRASSTVRMSYDNASAGASPVVLGSGTVIANSQCTLRGATSSASSTATTVTLRLDLGFSPTFVGTKYVYILAAEPGINTGLQSAGVWTVTAATPTVDSLNPSSGSGYGDMFNATVTDPVAQANISGISLLFTAAGPSNACWVYFDRNQNRIGLYTDDLSTVNYKPLGSSAALQNTQCAVGYGAKAISGNSVTLTVYVLFKSPAFTGIKTAYVQAHTAATTSGWVPKGTWSVP